MIEARRTQTTFADGLIAEEVSDLWEPWMRHSDAVLEDAGLVEIVCQALSKRCKKSKTRGRKGTPADVVLRLLALKHMFNWSYDEMHREVRANLVYREFTRIGGGKVPDDKTMGRLARQLAVVYKIAYRETGKSGLQSGLGESAVYDLTCRRGVALQIEQRKQPTLNRTQARQAGGSGMPPLALTAGVNDEGFLNSTQLFQDAVDAPFLASASQFSL